MDEQHDEVKKLLNMMKELQLIIDTAGGDKNVKGLPALEMVVRIKIMTTSLEVMRLAFLRESNKAFEDLLITQPELKTYIILGAKVTQYSKSGEWTYKRTQEYVDAANEVDKAKARLTRIQEAQKNTGMAKRDTPPFNRDTEQKYKVTL